MTEAIRTAVVTPHSVPYHAGGGIDSNAISRIGRATQIREFHVGRAARAEFQVEGDVQASLVRDLVERLAELVYVNLILRPLSACPGLQVDDIREVLVVETE